MLEHILWQNWHCLEAICILGNSFSDYALTRQASRDADKDSAADCMRQLDAWCVEQEVWSDEHASSKVCKVGAKLQYLEGAFTQTSLMYYNRATSASFPTRPDRMQVEAWSRRNDPEML